MDIRRQLQFSESPVLRMAALKRVAEDPFSVSEIDLVRVLVADDSAVVRHEAAFLLSLLKEQHAIEGKDAHEALLKSVAKDPSILVRHEAALSLASWPGHETTEALEAAAVDGAVDVEVSALFAMKQIAETQVVQELQLRGAD